jgi:GGDEF domain-containing protein
VKAKIRGNDPCSILPILAPVPPADRTRISSSRRRHNQRLLKALSLVMAAFTILLEIQHLTFPGAGLDDRYFYRYAILYAAVAFVSLMFFALASTSRDPTSVKSAFTHWLYVSFLMLSAILLTWTDLHISRDFTALQFALMGLGLSFSSGPLGYAILFGASLAAIQILTWVFPGIPIMVSDRLVLTLNACFGMVVALLMESQRLRHENAALALERDNAELRERASLDRATGVFNFCYLMDSLAKRLRDDDVSAIPFSLGILSLRGLEAAEEAGGRRSLDAIMARAAGLLRPLLRPGDVLARCGDGRFALIMPQRNLALADQTIENIKAVFRKADFQDLGWNPTIEGAGAQASRGDSPESLLERAEAALFSSRKAGTRT